jgi:hypothetical protein
MQLSTRLRNRQLFALLALSLALLACGKDRQAKTRTDGPQAKTPEKPNLPQSVSPGWKLASLAQSSAPPGVSAGGSQDCLEGTYTGVGSALVWLCRFADRAGAFHALQSTKTQRQIVTFQEGEYLVVVEWTADSVADLTALIHAVKENLTTHPPR